MTYQELLVEFSNRRVKAEEVHPDIVWTDTKIADLDWAIQSILEKLRDAEPGIDLSPLPLEKLRDKEQT